MRSVTLKVLIQRRWPWGPRDRFLQLLLDVICQPGMYLSLPPLQPDSLWKWWVGVRVFTRTSEHVRVCVCAHILRKDASLAEFLFAWRINSGQE